MCRQSLDKAYSVDNVLTLISTLFPSEFALWGPGDIYVGDIPHAATGLTSWPGPTWPLPFTVASPEQPFPVLASLFWNHPTSFQACALEVPVPQISSHLCWPPNLSAAPRPALPCLLSRILPRGPWLAEFPLWLFWSCGGHLVVPLVPFKVGDSLSCVSASFLP